jgi:methionyl-tRNA synthetase
MTLEEFKNCDLRVGTVLTAERVEGSDKLLKLHIALDGDESRQILSGIGKAYAPEEMIGRQVVIIANLEPRMMMGLESQGMLLAASNADGQPVILTTLSEVAPGTRIT